MWLTFSSLLDALSIISKAFFAQSELLLVRTVANFFSIFQVKRVVDSDEDEEDEKEETDKCTICLSEFVEDEDVR